MIRQGVHRSVSQSLSDQVQVSYFLILRLSTRSPGSNVSTLVDSCFFLILRSWFVFSKSVISFLAPPDRKTPFNILACVGKDVTLLFHLLSSGSNRFRKPSIALVNILHSVAIANRKPRLNHTRSKKGIV